jgi:hypothetical protein
VQADAPTFEGMADMPIFLLRPSHTLGNTFHRNVGTAPQLLAADETGNERDANWSQWVSVAPW